MEHLQERSMGDGGNPICEEVMYRRLVEQVLHIPHARMKERLHVLQTE